MPSKDNHLFFVMLDHPSGYPVPVINEEGNVMIFRTTIQARVWAQSSPEAQEWGFQVHLYIDRRGTPWKGFGNANDLPEHLKRSNRE